MTEIEVSDSTQFNTACKTKDAKVILAAPVNYTVKNYDSEGIHVVQGDPDAKLVSASTSGDGFVRPRGLLLDGVNCGRLYIQKSQGTALNETRHSDGLYIRGGTTGVWLNCYAEDLRSRFLTMHGLYAGKYEWIKNVSGKITTRRTGDDPFFGLGVDGINLEVDMEDVSGYLYSGRDYINTKAIHADGLHLALVKNATFTGRGSRIQWQGAIAGPCNALWYPGHWNDNVTIEVNWDQIGSSYLGIPNEYRSGGAAVMLFSVGEFFLGGSVGQAQYADLVSFYSWNPGEKDPLYSKAMQRVHCDAVWDIKYDPPTTSSTAEQAVGPPVLYNQDLPTYDQLQNRVAVLEARIAQARAALDG